MAWTTSQSGWNTELGIGYFKFVWDSTGSIKPVLSVANMPVIWVEQQLHSKRRRSKHTTLSIPWPSARNERGSWPSTGPAPWASLVPSTEHSTQPYEPSNATADPSLQAIKDEDSIRETMLKGSNCRCIVESSCVSQSSSNAQYDWNDVGGEDGMLGQ